MHATVTSFLLCLQFFISSLFAIPAVPPSLDALTVDLPPSNRTINNTTETSLGQWLPHTYRVPNSNTQLRYKFGLLIRRRVDPVGVVLLLQNANRANDEDAAEYGWDTPIDVDNEANFVVATYNLGLWIRRLPPPDNRPYTHRHIRDVLRGLYDIMIEGNKFHEITFKFSSGDARGNRQLLGQGSLWNEVTALLTK